MLIVGIDDAGRGPLIGPMFLAGVLISSLGEKELKQEGVSDSKILSHPTRIRLAGIIKDKSLKFKVVNSSATDIDHSLASGVNLNTLEAIKCAEIIDYLLNGVKDEVKIIVDCPSINTKAWKSTLLGHIKHQKGFELYCEHKADSKYSVVGAASILAKVGREEAISILKEKYGDFGSGYPSDPVTKIFLKEKGEKYKSSGIFRKSWSTWKSIYGEKVGLSMEKQKKLF